VASTAWQLRYRSPLSPTKGVDDVIIETDGDTEAEAQALAEWWLRTHVPSPSTRFVYVRRLVVATSTQMREAIARAAAPAVDMPEPGGANAQAASRDPSVPPVPGDSDDDRRPRGRGAVPVGRVGA
jgi:hypothetical protein